MKDKIFSVLQRVGRSFMLPIAILPVAGLLLGIGSSFTNATTIETYGLTSLLGNGTILHALLVIMNKVGSAVFDNLPLIFAVGVAIGMAKKEKEVSALSAVIAYFVMNTAINAMLTITGQILENGEIAESVLEGTITSVCGIQSLQMGVSPKPGLVPHRKIWPAGEPFSHGGFFLRWKILRSEKKFRGREKAA